MHGCKPTENTKRFVLSLTDDEGLCLDVDLPVLKIWKLTSNMGFRFLDAHLRVSLLLYRSTKNMECNTSFPFPGCIFACNCVATGLMKCVKLMYIFRLLDVIDLLKIWKLTRGFRFLDVHLRVIVYYRPIENVQNYVHFPFLAWM